MNYYTWFFFFFLLVYTSGCSKWTVQFCLLYCIRTKKVVRSLGYWGVLNKAIGNSSFLWIHLKKIESRYFAGRKRNKNTHSFGSWKGWLLCLPASPGSASSESMNTRMVEGFDSGVQADAVTGTRVHTVCLGWRSFGQFLFLFPSPLLCDKQPDHDNGFTGQWSRWPWGCYRHWGDSRVLILKYPGLQLSEKSWFLVHFWFGFNEFCSSFGSLSGLFYEILSMIMET